MANSHVSYLQTLPKDEAIALAASLQKVKEHLSHELHWMNEQVQQKTVQLQGIDTLLSEAAGLELASPHTLPTPETTGGASEISASEISDAAVTEAVLSSVSQATASPPDQATLAVANGSHAAASSAASTAAAVSPLAASAPPKRGRQRQSTKPSKAKRDVEPSVGKSTTSTAAPTAKKAEQPTRLNSDASKASLSGFQMFLQTSFQDKSMTDAVGEILASANEPLNTDAIMAELYHGLSNDAYQRAKSSLSNILSVGKTKGKWKSPTRGMYIGNAVAVKAK